MRRLKERSFCSNSAPAGVSTAKLRRGKHQWGTISRKFADRGLIVLAVNVGEPDQTVKRYLAEHPRSVPMVLTEDTSLAAIYVAVDRDGNIAGEQRGAAGERGLGRLLRRAGLEVKTEAEN
jgi:hypothetical protein